MSCSIEYIFREVSMRKHCVHVVFENNIVFDGKPCDQLIITEIVLSDDEKEEFLKRTIESTNTYGKFLAKCFRLNESPFDAKEIEIDTNNIIEFEHR